MRKVAWLPAAFTILAAAGAGAAPPAWNWASDPGSAEPEFAASRAICLRLGPPAVPPADRPGASEIPGLKGCDAEALYYGIGAPRQPEAARKCAILVREGGDDVSFSGSALLMEAYANGQGAARSPDLATRLACAEADAPAEVDGRVRHLQALRPGEAFSWCDDITSGYAGGVCAAHEQRMAGARRERDFAAFVARLRPAARAVVPALRAREADFAAAQSRGETDLSGTLRAALVIDAEEADHKQFLIDLGRLANGRWPPAGPADAAAADAALNRAYRAALAWADGKANLSTVRADDIRTAQRAWVAYRDAWIAVGAASGASREAVAARVTRLRTAQLHALAAD